MYATNYFETMVLNTFNNITAVGANALYAALFLSNPTETGIAGNEVNYIGYERQRITFTPPYAESGGIGIKNDADLLWDTAPGDVGQVKYIGIYDSAALGSGNMWLYGELSIPLTVSAQQQPSIYAGDLLYYSVGHFSTSFKTKVMNLLRGQNLPGFTPYFSLYSGDPESAGAELSGGAYERPALAFSAPAEQPSGQMMIQNTNIIRFPSPTSVWGSWEYDGLRDAPTSGELVLKSINPTPEVLQKNYVPSIAAGDCRVMLN